MLPFLYGKNAPQEQALCREVQEAVESGRITAEVREKLGLPGNDRVAVGLLRTWAQDGTITRLIGDVQAGQVRGELERRGEWSNGEKKVKFAPADSNDIIIEQEIRSRILSNEFPKSIRIGQQRKHQKGTHEYKQYVKIFKEKGEYGPSRITISNNEIEQMIYKYAGTGKIRIKNGKWLNYEMITTNDKIVGVVVNNLTGEEVLTTTFKIHYSKNGVHIVPDYPSKKGNKQ